MKLDRKQILSLNGLVRQRLFLVFLMLMAIVNTYTMRVSLNMAIVTMCQGPIVKNTTAAIVGEILNQETLDWDRKAQGYVKSGFYWGYVITHIPGGALADKYGGKWILFGGLASTTVFTLLIPAFSKLGWEYLLGLRILTGLGEGVVFPSIGVLLAKWSPLSERSRLGSITLSGAQLGTVITNFLTGLLLSAYRWEVVFYFYGVLGVLFCTFWAFLAFSMPELNPYITDHELEYLKNTVAPTRHIDRVPWKSLLLSWQVWGLVVGQIGHDWGLFTMIHELPMFMHDVSKFGIRNVGFLNALPFLMMWICSILLGILADWIIVHDKMSIRNVRRVWTLIASVVPALGMMLITVPEDRYLAIAIIVFGMAGMGGYYPGMRINALDITKNYAGTVMAFHNGLGATAGLASPILVGYIVPNGTREEWRLAYIITGTILIISCIFYCFTTRDKRQIWDYQHDEEKPEPKPKENFFAFFKKLKRKKPEEGQEADATPAAK